MKLKQISLFGLILFFGLSCQPQSEELSDAPAAYSVSNDSQVLADSNYVTLTVYEIWVEYAVDQKVKIEKEGILPDAGLTTEVYYLQHFYVALPHPPSMTWVQQRVKPHREGARPVRLMKVVPLRKVKQKIQQ